MHDRGPPEHPNLASLKAEAWFLLDETVGIFFRLERLLPSFHFDLYLTRYPSVSLSTTAVFFVFSFVYLVPVSGPLFCILLCMTSVTTLGSLPWQHACPVVKSVPYNKRGCIYPQDQNTSCTLLATGLAMTTRTRVQEMAGTPGVCRQHGCTRGFQRAGSELQILHDCFV
jgi:hypothetical protein